MFWPLSLSDAEVMDLIHFMTESIWFGMLIFIVVMVIGSTIAFLIELRKFKGPPDKGGGG